MEVDAPWSLTVESVLDSFQLRSDEIEDGFAGLDDSTVLSQRDVFGTNELENEATVPLWKLVLEQFQDQLVIILLIAAAISFVLAMTSPSEDSLADFFEPLVILLILIANAVVGVLQERNAESALDALKSHQPEYAVVIRNRGKRCKVPANDIVPGDLVEISAGDKVPADARIVKMCSSVLYVDQSLATGESDAVAKTTSKIPDSASLVLQDKVCMLFGGTTVVRGKAVCVITATGAKSEIGKIHNSLSEESETTSPLKRKLDAFGDFLSKVILVICIAVWLVNIGNFSSHGNWMAGALYYFKIAVALAVAAIPEGLPAVVTTCLALGTKRMSKRNAIVRHLPAVESLGCTTVICSDKTGTLTTNNMAVLKVALLLPSDEWKEFDVTGSGLSPSGEFVSSSSGKSVQFPAAPSSCDKQAVGKLFSELAEISTLCNESSVVYSTEKNTFEKLGEGTEAALTVLAEKIGMFDEAFCQSLSISDPKTRTSAVRHYAMKAWRKLATLDFSRDRKSMSVLVERMSSARMPSSRLMVKGAPESVIARSSHARDFDGSLETTRPLTDAARKEAVRVVERWSADHALRCLALAVRDDGALTLESMSLSDLSAFSAYESNLTLIGVVGMLDPPRKEVQNALEKCRQAGIRVIVITGDNVLTAVAICKMIGLIEPGEDTHGKVFTGSEWDAMSVEEKKSSIQTAKVFARVEPAHKQQLVEMLQSHASEVVAMTGDGVNDAPALKKADIGIAMGSGTAVAREVSSMVLADDNFATIVAAVEEGRAIYANMKQFIRYLISSNIGEVWCIFLTALLGMPEALIPVQLLWVNLVTDGLPATALSFNPEDDDVMEQPPRGMDDPVVDAWLFFRYMVVGTYVGVATVAGFAWWYLYYEFGPKLSWNDLVHFNSCSDLDSVARGWSCSIFETKNASTVALTILVTIEMLNALNAISENQSMLVFSPFRNPYLMIAVFLSMALHAVILYVPFFNRIFQTSPLTLGEWAGVMYLSIPVIIIDEILKLIARTSKTAATTLKKNV